MSKPEGVTDEAWGAALELWAILYTNRESDIEEIARAIMAAEKRGEEREREACAAIIDANMLCGDDRSNKEVLLPRGTSGNKVGVAYAAAIRARSA